MREPPTGDGDVRRRLSEMPNLEDHIDITRAPLVM